MEWIKAIERLPAKTEVVIACLGGCDIALADYYTDSKTFWVGANEYRPGAVTHWMTLPNPPKD